MKLFLSSLIMFVFIGSSYAQTTIQEYNFLTQEYKTLASKGVDPKLEGYYLEDLMELADRSGKVKLFYKNDQESVIPVATQFHIYTDVETFYVCVPHENSSKEIFNRYSDDIQRIFSNSSQAQSIFSILMVQYPIELQKFYDEIRKLELAYAKNEDNTTTQPQVNPTITQPNNNNALPNNDSRSANNTNSADIVIINSNQKVDLKTYEIPKDDRTATGYTTNELSASLRTRKLLARPEFVNNTGVAGSVRIDICIGGNGKVITTKYNAKDSDTNNRDLVDNATKLVRQYKFSRSSQSRKCGYVIFKFN